MSQSQLKHSCAWVPCKCKSRSMEKKQARTHQALPTGITLHPVKLLHHTDLLKAAGKQQLSVETHASGPVSCRIAVMRAVNFLAAAIAVAHFLKNAGIVPLGATFFVL